MNTTTVLMGVVIIAFLAIGLIPCVLLRLPTIKRNYHSLDDRALIGKQVVAKRQWRNFLIMQYAGPMLIIAMMLLLKDDKGLRAELEVFASVTFVSAFAVRKFYAALEQVIAAEIEYRRFLKGKDTNSSEHGMC